VYRPFKAAPQFLPDALASFVEFAVDAIVAAEPKVPPNDAAVDVELQISILAVKETQSARDKNFVFILF
jgi:hypothetical protein